MKVKNLDELQEIINNPIYYYDGDDLGLTYSEEESIFKVWAPTAQEVKLVIFEEAGEYYTYTTDVDYSDGVEWEMDRDETGTWSATIEGNLEDKYYLYKVGFSDGTVNYAVDPYAFAVTANGGKTAIIDLTKTNPENWKPELKPAMQNPTDAIIYELHVRDFSIDENSGIENKGKFLAFTEKGTVNKEGNPTGIDHLRDLGVTHIQLLPAYDFKTIDELEVDNPESELPKFNWGYDPQNFNAPEGSYSTDANNPYSRIIEFKSAVQALHENGMRVIMDVVYNHTYETNGSNFNKIVPGYYFRQDKKGKYTNGSGTGNEVASERPMVRKYLKDSVKFWVKEYGIDGYRFDLMGLIDTQTMTELVKELHEIDPSIIVLGEPWHAGGTSLRPKDQTLKGSQRSRNFSVFNDHFRNAVRGDGGNDGSTGYATGMLNREIEVVEGIIGSLNDFADFPNESINYVTAHDNLNLWDKVINTQKLNKKEGFLELSEGVLIGKTAQKYTSIEEAVEAATIHHSVDTQDPFSNETVRRSVLMNGIMLTSQGVPFIHAGDEILRSKFGDHNSYRSPDAINKIRWEWKSKFIDVFNYYQGLIKLRKEHPAFRMMDIEEIDEKIEIIDDFAGVISFVIRNNANNDSWKEIFVIYNADDEEMDSFLPSEGDWHLVVDDKRAGTDILETITVKRRDMIGAEEALEHAPDNGSTTYASYTDESNIEDRSEVSGNVTVAPLSMKVLYKN